MEKVVITTFTDPMMGLSWECEPLFRKLETHFAGQIEFRTVMSLLVRDVRDFMLPSELALGMVEGIRQYNARLATIYKSEEPIAGMPINMDGFCLFDEAHTTSYPLNLAYKAAELTAPEKAARFLYDLRYATVVDTRPTTHEEEILAVVRKTGIDENRFLRHWQDGSAEEALKKDHTVGRSLGIRTLPAYLIRYGESAALLQSFDYADFVSVIERVSGGAVKPQPVALSAESVRGLLRDHPRISMLELREAFDLPDTESSKDSILMLLKPDGVCPTEEQQDSFLDTSGVI